MDDHELWLEKRGIGPLPHYRLVKRRRRDDQYGLLLVGLIVLSLWLFGGWGLIVAPVVFAMIEGVLG